MTRTAWRNLVQNACLVLDEMANRADPRREKARMTAVAARYLLATRAASSPRQAMEAVDEAWSVMPDYLR